MNNREFRDATAEVRNAPADSGASTPAELHQAGLRHLQAGRFLDAQLCCRQALASDPHHVDALQLMGLLCLQAKQFDHAVEWIARANQRDIKSDHLLSLGIALEQQGLHQEALGAFDRALQLRPQDTELWLSHGKALERLGRPADALASYRRLLELDPRHGDAAHRCGHLLLNELNRAEEALSYFNLCDLLHPDHAGVLEQRCYALLGLRRTEEALADGLRASALNPANPVTCNNIGVALQLLGREREALPWFDKTIALQPDSIAAVNSKAFALTQLQRFDEAFAAFDRAKAIDPDNADVELNLSLLQLLTGDLAAGWAGREARWRSQFRPPYPAFPQPMWRGDAGVEGKTVLIYEDEGLGDTLQFARYIPMLASRGARVILVVGEPAYPVLAAMPGVSQCFPKPVASLPAFDLHCPICTLPLAFGTRLDTIPATTPYLPAPAPHRLQAWEERLQARLGPRKRLRVGIVWSGRPSHLNDHNRSIPFRIFSRLLDADADFISLQKDPRPADRTLLEQTDVLDLTAHFTDFAETAALASCVDLVITVDTSVAHLAGALGRPTWLLLPYTPDFRWLLGRADSPWYPTLRLFRQDEDRDWEGVLDLARRELASHRA